MKSEVIGVGAPQNKKDLKDPLNESKETNAADVKSDSSNRTFGMVDLWNIQKRQRAGASMRRRFI